MKLSDFIHFQAGQMLTRLDEDISGKEYYLYSSEQFSVDLQEKLQVDESENKIIRTNKEVPVTREGMILISSIYNQAVIVKKAHEGYLLSSNYIIITMNPNVLDPKFFCYWFNESKETRKQILLNQQGSSVSRLSIREIKNFEITMPKIEIQKSIGQVYVLQARKTLLEQRKAILSQQVLYQTLNQIQTEGV